MGILELLFIVIVVLDIIGIFYVLTEDFLYIPFQKFYKVLFIILVPIIGACVEIYLISRYIPKRKDNNRNNTSESQIESLVEDSGSFD